MTRSRGRSDRRSTTDRYDRAYERGYDRGYDDDYGRERPPVGVGSGGRRLGGGGNGGGGPMGFSIGQIAVLAGVLVVGIGIGTGISSTTQ
ncbi:MAG: DUF3172 domain-containing protein, partial [Cyanobacteriota bacterium]|nr:DUF3172 domain-containing protein [Cyanobacteriota bacterium]